MTAARIGISLSVVFVRQSPRPIPTTATTIFPIIRRVPTTTPPRHLQSSRFSSLSKLNMIHTGGCYCGEIKYEIDLASPDEARTSICHCKNCRKWTGSAFGITAKIPKKTFKITRSKTKEHVSDNGSGTELHREFCDVCGSGILEYGANAGDFTYINYGTLDKPDELPPKGEFFCKVRAKWLPEIPDIFHKQEIKT